MSAGQQDALAGRVWARLEPLEPDREAMLKTVLAALRCCRAPKVTVEDEVLTATFHVPPALPTLQAESLREAGEAARPPQEQKQQPPEGPGGKK
jgi:hypothetical protein